MRIARLEAMLVDLRMKKPFRVSFGELRSRATVIVRIEAEDGRVGYGEAAALPEPSFSPETPDTCMHIIERYLGPSVIGQTIASPADLVERIAWVRGHNFAKTGIESAVWHAFAEGAGVSLATAFGGVRGEIPVGESIGIHGSVEELLEEVELRVAQGFQRIKLKVQPGWDMVPVEAVRQRVGGVPVMVDANSAYDVSTSAVFRAMDEFGLLMIEQPLAANDLAQHAQLQRSLRTSICLDESIDSPAAAQAALMLQSCRIVNIKPGRAGGPSAALAIHDLCHREGLPVWMGGMFESGIGRAFNIALASLPGFSLPADMSPASYYFEGDLVSDAFEVTERGTIAVPMAAGLGFRVDEARVRQLTKAKVEMRA